MDESKFNIARHLLSQLDAMGEERSTRSRRIRRVLHVLRTELRVKQALTYKH